MKKSTEVILLVLIALVVFVCMFLFMYLTDPTTPYNRKTVQSEDVKPAEVTMVSLELPASLSTPMKNEIQRNLEEKIDLVCDTYPTDIYYNMLNATLNSSTGPDLVMIEHPGVLGTLIPTSRLLPLNDYIEANWRSQLGAYSPETMYYTPPLGIKSYTAYYNKDVAERLGVDLSAVDIGNLPGILEAIQKNGYEPVSFGSKDWLCLRNLLVQLCTGPDERDPWQSAVNRLETIKPYLMSYSQLYDNEDVKLQFKNGNALIYFGFDNEFSELSSECNFNVGVMRLMSSGRYTVWYDYIGMYAINNNITNKVDTIYVLKAIASDDMQKRFSGYIPRLATQNVYGTAQYAENWMYVNGGKYLSDYFKKLEILQQQFFEN
jgi:ABC-type glycerol-3-phosphate transport system substrate-binding protein